MRHSAIVGALLGASAAVLPLEAAAVDKKACFAAHESGQQARNDGKLTAAREQLLVCADAACPDVVRAECAKWVTEITQQQPSLVFAVTDAQGKDVAVVSITVDGKEIATRLDGNPIAVDPGPHKLTFRIAGQPERTEEIVLRAGEQNRLIKVTWADGAAAPPVGPKAATDSSSGPEVHPAAWVLGTAGIIGLGLFAAFAALGNAEYAEAEAPASEGGCAPSCSEDIVDSVFTKHLVADISLGVGAASLGAAIIVAIVSVSGGDDEKPTVSLVATPTATGGFASFSASF